MTAKTISIDHDAYELLAREKRGRETLSQVVRRVMADRPLTTDELLEAVKPFWGKGAGPRRTLEKTHRHAAA